MAPPRQRDPQSLFLCEGVVDAGKQPDVCPKHPCQFTASLFTGGAVLIAEQIQRAPFISLPSTVNFSAAMVSSNSLFHAVATDDRLIVQKFFHLIRQLVRLHRPHTIKDRFVARVGVAASPSTWASSMVEFQTAKDQRSRW
jgi:hypothetical protein